MNKISKQKQNDLRDLLNSFMVGEFQKTLIKGILKNSEQKNLSRADMEVADDLIRRFT